jgi:hypothetical protein
MIIANYGRREWKAFTNKEKFTKSFMAWGAVEISQKSELRFVSGLFGRMIWVNKEIGVCVISSTAVPSAFFWNLQMFLSIFLSGHEETQRQCHKSGFFVRNSAFFN